MPVIPSSTPQSSTPPFVFDLISPRTQSQIRAGSCVGNGPERCQWVIARPPFVTEPGRCYLLVTRQANGTYTVAVGRQGMCADVYTEAVVKGVTVDDVEATVLRVCLARTMAEVQP